MRKKNSRKQGKPTPDLPEMMGEGVAPQPRNPTLERLADDWLDAKSKLEAVKESADDAKENLVGAMRISGTTRYEYDGHVILLESKDKVTIKDVDAAEAVE